MGCCGTVENHQSVDVHSLYRMGALRETLVELPLCSFRWPGIVRVGCNRWRLDVEFRGGAQQGIPIVWTRCHFGSGRPWFMCMRCNRRVGKLYNSGASLACRRCRDLRYSCQRRGAKSRSYLQALKLRLRLNDVAKIGGPPPERPRRMHKKTYYRLCRRLEELEKKLGPRFRFRETGYGPLVPK
jgi:hypothetical protein